MKQNKKRGIRIQTRIIITAVILVIQLLLLQLAVFSLKEKAVMAYAAAELIGIITVVGIINKRGNPSYKIAWIVFILIMPVFGLCVYLVLGGERMFPHIKRKMRRCWENYKRYLHQDEETQKCLEYESSAIKRQVSFLQNESGFPVYSESETEYLSPGEVFLPRFLEELRQAKRYIFLEYFIIAEGEMWSAIVDVLEQKAAQGVEVKVIFDDFGSICRQYKDFVARMRQKGIIVSVFNRIGPSFNIFMNNRDHRKIAIIDGQVAFTGGLNLADEYINAEKRFGYWMDSAILIRGKAVDSFLVMFNNMWEYITGERIKMSDHLLSKPVENSSLILPYCDGPINHNNPAEGIYMQILNTAHRYVYIATPYLILDNEMVTVITLAAKSGVDVRIVTPFVPDKWYVHPVTQYYYKELLDAGVRIYEYTPGFMHSKLFVCDDSVATVGTVNMDYRSFYFHFECGVWLTDANTVGDIKSQFMSFFRRANEITKIKWKHRPLWDRFLQWVLHIFAPFM